MNRDVLLAPDAPVDPGPQVREGLADLSDGPLRQAAERFRMAVESAPNALVMVDAAGVIVLVNAQTERLFGYAREELLGKPVEILIPERVRPYHQGERAGYMRSPSTRQMGAGRDLSGRRKDGSEIPMEIGLNPFTTSEGTFVLAAIVDISERKEQEARVRKTAEDLARSNHELGQFAYVASHDLQEPLRTVAGCVELLGQRYVGKLDPLADELIQHAIDGASRMQTLIEDLLAYSRLDSRSRPFQAVECERVLGDAISNLAVNIRESKARITHDPLPTVDGEPSQLLQLFQNLLANALKFRAPDRAPEVHVGVTQLGDDWCFSVRDNGIGIEPQYFDRIFVIFQRLHSQRAYAGTGIGLAVCRKIVDRHGGRIWVESELGRGSAFCFTLPRRRP